MRANCFSLHAMVTARTDFVQTHLPERGIIELSGGPAPRSPHPHPPPRALIVLRPSFLFAERWNSAGGFALDPPRHTHSPTPNTGIRGDPPTPRGISSLGTVLGLISPESLIFLRFLATFPLGV